MKIVGINDEMDSCEVCGKTGLKRVVWIDDGEGNVVHVGTSCAARMLGNDAKSQKNAEKKWIDDNNAAAAAEVANSEEKRAFDKAVASAPRIGVNGTTFAQRKAHIHESRVALGAVIAAAKEKFNVDYISF